MVLSNLSIQKALDSGRIIIDPAPSPRNHGGSRKSPYDTTSVDLRLGNEIVEFQPQPPHHQIYLGDGGFENIAAQSEKHIISDERPYHLKHGKFVLAKTLERVALPILAGKKPLAARIEGKSTFARVGLLVHFTAPTIHSNFSGTITLEMANLGPYELILKPNMFICQLIVEEVQGVPFKNDSTFQGQSHPAGQK